MKKPINTASLTFIVAVICFDAFAQKLPNKQEGSVFAPATVRIDGNASEWENTFQAYNRATELSYTLANDADNLYLVCQATEPEVIQKIVLSGITLSVNATDKNSTIAPVKITYPIVPFTSVQINHLLKEPAPLKNEVAEAINKRISGQLKEVKVSGIKEFAEGTVPVYNDAGIVTAQNVTKEKVYTSELAFPLKYIRQLIDGNGTFNYGITVNGMDPSVKVVGGNSLYGSATDQAVAHGANYSMTPTYFTATYTLARKP